MGVGRVGSTVSGAGVPLGGVVGGFDPGGPFVMEAGGATVEGGSVDEPSGAPSLGVALALGESGVKASSLVDSSDELHATMPHAATAHAKTPAGHPLFRASRVRPSVLDFFFLIGLSKPSGLAMVTRPRASRRPRAHTHALGGAPSGMNG